MVRDYEEGNTTVVGDGEKYQNYHFEETLSSEDVGNASYWILIGVLIITVVPILFIIPAVLVFVPFDFLKILPKLPPIALAILGIVAFAFLGTIFILLGTIYFHKKTRTHVRVTDTGVEIEQENNPLSEHSNIEIPFGDIKNIQYSETEETHLHVKQSDRNAKTYMVQNPWKRRDGGTITYSGGIRIERGSGPPVYVGSTRPVELSETIARKTRGIEKPENILQESTSIF